MEKVLTWCTDCGKSAHVENCPDCMGRGLEPNPYIKGGMGPIMGGDIQRYKKEGGWTKCEICGGTPEGEWLGDEEDE